MTFSSRLGTVVSISVVNDKTHKRKTDCNKLKSYRPRGVPPEDDQYVHGQLNCVKRGLIVRDLLLIPYNKFSICRVKNPN